MQVSEQPLDFKSLIPDLVETSTGRKIQQASATRWFVQFFKDIPLIGNLGAEFINSLTLATPAVSVIKRCQPYPLTNCEYEVPKHERKSYGDFGGELDGTNLGNYSGADPKGMGTPEHFVESKFAYSAARELSDRYAKEFGLVILEPLTGIDDANLVRQIFSMVQPMTYPLHKLDYELNDGAKERIKKSTHTQATKDLADQCRQLMLKGVAAAKKCAGEHMMDFSRQVQLAGAGQKGNRAFAAPFDEFVAEQLNVEVPRVVQTEKRSTTNDELLAKLAERELSRGGENDALLAALLESNATLTAQVQELMAARNGTKVSA